MANIDVLPSWRPGPTREALVGFLESAIALPIAERVAYFDNDGTLWCERPTYIQYDFFVDHLRTRVAAEPSLADRPEFQAVLAGDATAIGELGLARIALALAGLFEGLTAETFDTLVRGFMETATHAMLDRPLHTVVYQPMLELIDELRRLEFTVGIVTGGGTEFVRAVSADLYGVPSELVVGTLVDYEFGRDADGRPIARRTARVLGDANEGPAKVTNIQTQLGRRPILAAGNSRGDAEMLEWAGAGGQPGLALLIDHDDADREFAYVSRAETIDSSEEITATARRLGWTVVSMADDWDHVFAPVGMERA